MEIETVRQVDLLFALFLGRLPESNFVRHDNLGRPALELVRAMISSDEFRQSIIERFLLYETLPHRGLSLELLPDALALAADAGLAPPPHGFVTADWKSALGRVLTQLPCRGLLEAVCGVEGHQLIGRLNGAPPSAEKDRAGVDGTPAPTADIVSGIEMVADTICRGWLVDRAKPDTRLFVKVTVNGAFAKVFQANEFRRDVQDLYGGEGRCGFTLRVDRLPHVRELSRATIEITELVTGAVVLSEHIVELSPVPLLAVGDNIREELAQVRECLTTLRSSLLDGHQRRPALTDMLRGLNLTRSETSLSLLRADLGKLSSSLNQIEQDLPRLWTEHCWTLSRYGTVRSTVELVLPAPRVEHPATFSIVVIADDADQTQATLSSVFAQVLKPHEIFLVASSDTTLPALSAAGAFETVRYGVDRSRVAVINAIGGRATGSQLLILDAGTTLAPEALGWFAAAIDRTKALVFYADEEITAADDTGRRQLQPIFRPAFDYDLLLQRNYVGSTLSIDRQLFNTLGGLNQDLSLDAWHDFLLRAVAKLAPGNFVHVPQLLTSSAKSIEQDDAQRALARTLTTVQAHLDQTGLGALAVPHLDPIGRSVRDAVKILWRHQSSELISVIIPTRDRADMVFALISSMRRRAAIWENVEVVVIVNGETSFQSRFAFSEIENTFERVKILYRDVQFNWAEINNTAARESAEGTILVFLNDDIICQTEDWDRRLNDQLARPEIGVIGGRLLYPNGTIQHAGIALCGDRRTAHEAMGDAPADGLYLDRTLLVHNIGAVTGAFLACRRGVFEHLGGFDAERYAVTSSDADFCVRARMRGVRVLYDPFLTWIHYESASRGLDSQDHRKSLRAEAEHERWLANFSTVDRVDPSFNPHLARSRRPFETFHRISQEDIEIWLQAQLRAQTGRSLSPP